MKIQFVEGVLEYANGDYHRKNNGKPFDVDRRFAEDVLLPSGYFESLEAVEAREAEEAATVETLAKLKREELEERAKEAGLDGDSYTNKHELATAIVNAEKEAEG